MEENNDNGCACDDEYDNAVDYDNKNNQYANASDIMILIVIQFIILTIHDDAHDCHVVVDDDVDLDDDKQGDTNKSNEYERTHSD